jgi:hypothetical protein
LTRTPPFFRTRCYGLRLQSDGPIPGLEPDADPGEPPDLSIRLGTLPEWAGSAATEIRQQSGQSPSPQLRFWQFEGDRVLFHYPDGTRFYLDLPRGELWATWPAVLSLEDTATYLLGPVLGYFLRRRGVLCLHGSAVLLGERCVIFAGPAGAGKSTLAAALATVGWPVLTEDVCCLARQPEAFTVQPGYPRIRLWPESADLIKVPRRSLPLLTPNWDKRFLPLEESTRSFHNRPEHLAAVLMLTPREGMPEPARVRDLGGKECLMELAANTYSGRRLNRDERGKEFAELGDLARTVPIRALTLNADGSRLLEACAWIERHALA